ncbi:hypothetical protein CHS0354_042264 [Potamilus streckersoni]|uniref:Uncharacterized protein n=1 Tax=Potamilus streckersoni TaxID=2493646 RepID=A0AAE0SUR6_9BIVA|nr:hypothetical protein CHS0354_042264 [Potamilus streckersoni]
MWDFIGIYEKSGGDKMTTDKEEVVNFCNTSILLLTFVRTWGSLFYPRSMCFSMFTARRLYIVSCTQSLGRCAVLCENSVGDEILTTT